MALVLAPAARLDWFRQHAGVAECNSAYLQLNRLHGLADADARKWSADTPWSKIYFDNMASGTSTGYSIDGLQFTIGEGHGRKTFLTEFTGVIVEDHLVRVWGVARDISMLVDLNKRLQQKQERVQMYARQRAGAEERARRATAVDLHDGIGQQLVGLAMTLDAAATRSLPEVRLLARRGHSDPARHPQRHAAGDRGFKSAGTLRAGFGAGTAVAERLSTRPR